MEPLHPPERPQAQRVIDFAAEVRHSKEGQAVVAALFGSQLMPLEAMLQKLGYDTLASGNSRSGSKEQGLQP